MGNSIVKAQVGEVMLFLGETVQILEDFLNQTTLDDFKQGASEDTDYHKSLLSNLRRLEVYCTEGLEACKIINKNKTFHKGAAEKTLYTIYHQCVEEFFSPRNDVWFEDSRSAYTGKNSIKFHQEVPDSFKGLVKELESGFQTIREDLEYYETDYRTKMLQSK